MKSLIISWASINSADMGWIKNLFGGGGVKKRRFNYRGIIFDETTNGLKSYSIKVADVEQTIKGVRQLTATGITDMVTQRDNLEYQLRLCQTMMRDGDILPYPWERAVILLKKQKRHEEELELCRYASAWCIKAEREWDGHSAMQWRCPRLQRCINRIPKIEKLVEKNRTKTL